MLEYVLILMILYFIPAIISYILVRNELIIDNNDTPDLYNVAMVIIPFANIVVIFVMIYLHIERIMPKIDLNKFFLLNKKHDKTKR